MLRKDARRLTLHARRAAGCDPDEQQAEAERRGSRREEGRRHRARARYHAQRECNRRPHVAIP
eukprot:3105938-Rhodomonas_salina.4